MNIQICILTGQPLANLIPLLQYRPDRIALLVSDELAPKLPGFLETLHIAGWQQDQIDCFEHMPDQGYEQIINLVEQLGSQLKQQHPAATLSVNLTGGNKLMSLGTMMALDTDNNALFYTDTKHQQIEFLDHNHMDVEPMQAVLNLPLCLKAAGLTLRNQQDADTAWIERAIQRKKATKYLADHADELAGLISQLNYNYANDNQQEYSSRSFNLKNNPKGPWLIALQELQQAGVLDWGDNTSHWRPAQEDTARYLSGGWLEEYAWHCARDAGLDSEHLGISVVITDDSNRKADIRNEGDVMLVANNRLLLIECKTGNLTRDGKDQDTINKLAILADKTGGIMAEGLLISSQPLERETREKRTVNSRARAHSMDLRTCEAGELKNLRKQLECWIKQGHWLDTK